MPIIGETQFDCGPWPPEPWGGRCEARPKLAMDDPGRNCSSSLLRRRPGRRGRRGTIPLDDYGIVKNPEFCKWWITHRACQFPSTSRASSISAKSPTTRPNFLHDGAKFRPAI